MGKRIIPQARGKGGPTYRAPSFKYKGEAKFVNHDEPMNGIIVDLVHCAGHSAPLMAVEYENGLANLLPAPEGVRVGDEIVSGEDDIRDIGHIGQLKDIPEGVAIYNIESMPGDGGKFVRTSGTFARIVGRQGNNVLVQLPSKKKKAFNERCKACVGVVAGGGRLEKPILRAGTAHFKAKAKNKLWPKVSGGSMNAVDHPFGNKRSSRKSKAKPAPKNAPPGRKVGMIRPRQTGRKRGKRRRE